MRKKLLLIPFLSLLFSCAPTLAQEIESFASISEQGEHFVNDTNGNGTSEDDPYASYTQLSDLLSVSVAPGLYSSAQVIDFHLENENYILYYSTNPSKVEISDMTRFSEPFIVDALNSKNIKDFPCTKAVDGILSGDSGGKCVSDTYNTNIQNNHNYYFLPKQPVVTIKLYDPYHDNVVFSRSLSYIIRDDADTIDIPIVSLSMPYNDLFSSGKGFYNKIREEIEKRANLEYIDPVYDEYFFRNTQIKLGGGWSIGYPQRTLNLNFKRDENGAKNKKVQAHIFGERKKRGSDEPLTEFTRFRLHNGGNCFEDYTGFNDALLQNMMEGTTAGTTAYRPCIAYINGEYWGNYAIREHYKAEYFAANYGVNKDDVMTFKYAGGYTLDEGDETTAWDSLNAVFNYINAHNLSNNNYYRTFINNYIDVNSLIDVFVAESFCGNWDFVGNANNLRLWATSKTVANNPYADGKWRFLLHDADFAFADYNNCMSPNYTFSYSKLNIMGALLKNAQFKERFIERARELLEGPLSLENGIEILDQMVSEIKPYKYDAFSRWGQTDAGYKRWENIVNNTYGSFAARHRTYLADLEEALALY